MGESDGKGWFIGRGHTNGTIKLAMAGSLVLNNGGADFLHSQFIDSI